ncbi:MAG: cobyrinate a,c-diamide synthase [Lachnospiraceae bacterium]|nr:cobyrinate a,c-diamide synthase [Lachnospiraceae bacterium]
MKRILIAGTKSGCGKTTMTLALLAALKKWGVPVASFKCGPDYIDPMFHRAVLGVETRNLDPFFSSPEELRAQLRKAEAKIAEKYGSSEDGILLVEGVMGYYDGLGRTSECSTYSVAAATGTPVVLVVEAGGMSASVGAVLQGFRNYKADSGIKGVIFNGVSEKMQPFLKAIAEENGLRCLGCMPHEKEVTIGSRHLGLVTAQEISELQRKVDMLAEMAERCLDLELLWELAEEAPMTEGEEKQKEAGTVKAESGPVIGIARDAAFCFQYPENLEILEKLGCRLRFFSPLKEQALPEGISGLWLPGGYPELYLQELEQNEAMRTAVRAAVEGGMPTIAECGGFLYLHESAAGHQLAGVLAGQVFETKRLQRFGYTYLTARKDNLLGKAGEMLRTHEFHYWDSPDIGEDYEAVKAGSGRRNFCVHATETLWAGFPHLYLPANPGAAEAFVRKAEEYACRTSSLQH